MPSKYRLGDTYFDDEIQTHCRSFPGLVTMIRITLMYCIMWTSTAFFFIYCQFSHFPIIFHFRHVGVREMHGVTDLAIGTVQWCNANLLTEISLRRTVSPPVKTSGSYITAKQFKNRCAFPALKIFSASLHVTILLIYYSTILLLY